MLKVVTCCRLVRPIKELNPVLVMRILLAWVTPVPPKDRSCNAARAVKFRLLRLVSCGNDNSDRTVRPPSSKPPIDLRSPNVKLASFTALLTVKLPVIFSTPLILSALWPLESVGSVRSVGMATEPLYVVQEARAEASADAVIVVVAELLH